MRLSRLVLMGLLLIVATPVNAGPVTFFRRVFGHHENDQPPPRRKKRETISPTPSPSVTPEVVNNDRPPAAPEVPETTPVPTPTPLTAQPASSVPASVRKQRSDFPYAVPVQGRPGFVTSPYSPNGGLVDVRGFSSGTEVKDPYTGKIFITP